MKTQEKFYKHLWQEKYFKSPDIKQLYVSRFCTLYSRFSSRKILSIRSLTLAGSMTTGRSLDNFTNNWRKCDWWNSAKKYISMFFCLLCDWDEDFFNILWKVAGLLVPRKSWSRDSDSLATVKLCVRARARVGWRYTWEWEWKCSWGRYLPLVSIYFILFR